MEAWIQSRQTKLGEAKIEIIQVQDLYEATVSLVNGGIDLIFQATETFGDMRTAFLWSYGLKQSINDDFAKYLRVGKELIESKPKKGQSPIVMDISQAIDTVKKDYDNFVLGRTSTSKGDTISVSQVKASTLSQDEQATLLALMARAKGKVVNE